MSLVTGVMIISQCCNEHAIEPLVEKLNEWIANDVACGGGRLFEVDQYFGGRKHPECLVWGGGFNYLSWGGFIAYAESLPWREAVTLPEEERVIMVVTLDQKPAQVIFLA